VGAISIKRLLPLDPKGTSERAVPVSNVDPGKTVDRNH
jgi:hypothetical protein